MADPFEVRLRFTNLLSHLSASTSSSIRCAQYALKHRDMDEDLHSCILEQLERNNMNNRANIMYFLEHFCELSIKEGYKEYVSMIQRDIGRIVDAVAPGEGGGVANVKVARSVLGALGERGVLDDAVVGQMESLLKGRERDSLNAGGLLEETAPPVTDAETSQATEGVNVTDVPREDLTAREQKMVVDSRPISRTTTSSSTKNVNGALRMDKRVIEQRIEEDRERNKRLRESVWAVGKGDQEELDKLWDETSEVWQDDFTLATEEAEERQQTALFSVRASA